MAGAELPPLTNERSKGAWEGSRFSAQPTASRLPEVGPAGEVSEYGRGPEQLNGGIVVVSAVGQGSRFWIELPSAEASNPPDAAESGRGKPGNEKPG